MTSFEDEFNFSSSEFSELANLLDVRDMIDQAGMSNVLSLFTMIKEVVADE